MNNLRESWCLSDSVFSEVPTDELFYDLGIRCGAPAGIFSKRIKIPVAEVPPEIRQLIALFD